LSTAWPLPHLDERKAKLSLAGLKSVDGQQLYEVQYHPKKSADLQMELYFDPTTFRHVKSVYWLTVRPSIVNVPGGPESAGPTGGEGVMLPSGNSETASARQHESHYRIEERFGEFSTVDGLTLPSHYDLRFTQELQTAKPLPGNGTSKKLKLATMSRWIRAISRSNSYAAPDNTPSLSQGRP
jgi:hypothetical protein